MKRYIIYICVCVCSVVNVTAQHNTSSPYTRYGYGTIMDGGFGQSRAMGGIVYGVRSKQYTNPYNPASYTAIDSLTFRLETGVSFQISQQKGMDLKHTDSNGNFEFVSFQFPIKKWVAFSLGLMPYSMVGYDIQQGDTIASTISAGRLGRTYQYEGSGGITQLYAGLAFRPFKNLSVGGNFLFNFGTIEHESRSVFSDKTYYGTTMTRSIKVKDVSGNFGVQGTVPMKNEHELTLGATFQMKSKMTSEASQTIITTDTTVLDFDNNFDIPMYIGVGLSYSYSDKFLFGFDYKRECWSDALFFGEKMFSDRNKFALGGQFLPNMNGRRYFQRVAYRLGTNFSESYYTVNGEQLHSFALTTGWGFPLKKGLNPTVINVAFEYGHNGSVSNGMIREQYFKFTLNATINERWFVKRKLN